MKDETLKATGRKQVKLYLSHEAADLLREAARRETLNMSSYVDVMLKRELRTADGAGAASGPARRAEADNGPVAPAPSTVKQPEPKGDFNLDL